MAKLDVSESLGERIVQAARLAMVIHQDQLAASKDDAEPMYMIGGAGRYLPGNSHLRERVTDGTLC